jgi:hypothetical protein
MGVQLPRRPYPGRSDSEQPFHDRHAGQRRRRERLPWPRRRAATLQYVVALRGVEASEVEPGGQRQGLQLDPVLERLARQPQRSRPQHHETMSKSALQECQPGAVRMIDEYH